MKYAWNMDKMKKQIFRTGFSVITMILYDLIAVHSAYFLALWGRFDFVFSKIPDEYLYVYQRSITVYAVLCILVFWRFHLYRSIWQYASYPEFVRCFASSGLLSVLYSVIVTLVFSKMPITYYLWGMILQFLLILGMRFFSRTWLFVKSSLKQRVNIRERIMVIGAGTAGQMILHDIIQHGKQTGDRVVCVIDDDPNKWHRDLEGVPVIGGRDCILPGAKKYHVSRIYLAIPSVSAAEKRDILTICNETDCELKHLPGFYQAIDRDISVNEMKDVSVEDLLGREPIRTDMKEAYDFIRGKTVLVTGGGGSIGSELCRQIAEQSPRRLILLDVYENSTYGVQLELKEKYPQLDLVVLIGSVRDSRRLYEIFGLYRPEIVYHAAAHKHVPLMEDSPCECIKNNAIGTYKTAYAAMVHGCERFVLISTDKAVNPTNIMGASKRICEMIIQSFDQKIKEGKAREIPQLFTHDGIENADKDGTGRIFENIHTEFVAVRFGNVLGSNGSVVPIFKKQIEKGGPVTVTHPDIIRYFMTIPEAVSLVMLAGTYAHGGEIFVLDMGSPVKIDTLARNLIKLSGYKPDEDIKIEYTGLRPGEKLFEEKLMAEEGLKKTENELIHIGCPIPFDVDEFLRQLPLLMQAAYGNRSNIRTLVMKIVSTYHPAQKEMPQGENDVFSNHVDNQNSLRREKLRV